MTVVEEFEMFMRDAEAKAEQLLQREGFLPDEIEAARSGWLSDRASTLYFQSTPEKPVTYAIDVLSECAELRTRVAGSPRKEVAAEFATRGRSIGILLALVRYPEITERVTHRRVADKGSRGGTASATTRKAAVAEKNTRLIERAQQLLATGRATHELGAILAKHDGRTARQIRSVLQEAGILEKRKRS